MDVPLAGADVPGPTIVRAPPPVIAPFNVTVGATVLARLTVLKLIVALPPLRLIGRALVKLEAPVLKASVVPLASVRLLALLPRLLSAEMASVPPLTETV